MTLIERGKRTSVAAIVLSFILPTESPAEAALLGEALSLLLPDSDQAQAWRDLDEQGAELAILPGWGRLDLRLASSEAAADEAAAALIRLWERAIVDESSIVELREEVLRAQAAQLADPFTRSSVRLAQATRDVRLALWALPSTTSPRSDGAALSDLLRQLQRQGPSAVSAAGAISDNVASLLEDLPAGPVPESPHPLPAFTLPAKPGLQVLAASAIAPSTVDAAVEAAHLDRVLHQLRDSSGDVYTIWATPEGRRVVTVVACAEEALPRVSKRMQDVFEAPVSRSWAREAAGLALARHVVIDQRSEVRALRTADAFLNGLLDETAGMEAGLRRAAALGQWARPEPSAWVKVA